MKTEPTDLDREAARLFAHMPGMRVMHSDGGWGRIAEAAWAGAALLHRTGDSMAASVAQIAAIDTDDPATVGCMLTQVEAMRPGQAVTVVDRLRSLPGEHGRRFAVLVEHDGAETVATGPTRGAALVVAMRALPVSIHA
jgi:hypothetical protein